MTTVADDLQTVLHPLAAGGAWYAMNTGSTITYPFITFTRVAVTPNVSLGGASALRNTRFQIDVMSRRASEAIALEAAVQTAMAAWATQNVQLSSLDTYEDAVQAYRVSLDYSVWSTN